MLDVLPSQLPTNMRGGNGKVAYIDTEGTLYPLLKLLLSCRCCGTSIEMKLSSLEMLPFLYVLSLTIYTCSRPDRIVPIAERFGMDPGAVLDNVSTILLYVASSK